MKQCVIAVLAAIAAYFSQPALAWAHEGHEVIGSIADELLSARAREQVAQILGFELRVAGSWADCARSVIRGSDGTFEYEPDPLHPQYSVACTAFQTPGEIARMEDYVRRNWSNCFYESGHGCDETYHFADVAIQHDHYDRAYIGTSDHDIVSAIRAAVIVLDGKPAPLPFSIRDKKEALFMLAHLVGDIHQPLHVGAVYLDPGGRLIDPDTGAPDDPKTHTAGGNFIHEQHGNLHSEWDQIPRSFGRSATPAIARAAAAVASTHGPPETWAEAWASDTILAARSAFAGASFKGDGHGHWVVVFADRRQYLESEKMIKMAQIEKAGARLAQLLNAMWP
ncbi:MAG: S1/P1 nuclease [Steroidobacteraceae bacterium]